MVTGRRKRNKVFRPTHANIALRDGSSRNVTDSLIKSSFRGKPVRPPRDWKRTRQRVEFSLFGKTLYGFVKHKEAARVIGIIKRAEAQAKSLPENVKQHLESEISQKNLDEMPLGMFANNLVSYFVEFKVNLKA